MEQNNNENLLNRAKSINQDEDNTMADIKRPTYAQAKISEQIPKTLIKDKQEDKASDIIIQKASSTKASVKRSASKPEFKVTKKSRSKPTNSVRASRNSAQQHRYPTRSRTSIASHNVRKIYTVLELL